MARTNKYASLNFNDIYDKKINNNNNKPINPSPSSSSIHNKTKITNSHIHGNMLVLTRPTPKPISQTQTQTQTQTPPPPQPKHPQPTPVNPDPTRPASNSDSISLRPLGSTGGSAAAVSAGLPRDLCFVSPKPDKFVPPHLRPGYVCKEESPVKNTGGYRQRQFGEEINRPKSGGGVGYDRMRKASTGPDFVFRPASGGNNRPNSTG